jgi:hypothetical protein
MLPLSHLHQVRGASLRFENLLVVIKQTAFEEYSQVREYSIDYANAVHSYMAHNRFDVVFVFLTFGYACLFRPVFR